MMSTTLKGVALGLSVPVVLAISGWTGWSALTANLPPAELATVDESGPVDISQPSEVPAAELEIEPGPEQLRAAAAPAQPSAPGPDRELVVAPAPVTDSSIKPATTGQAEPSPPIPRIRFVRVPKATADTLNATSAPASGAKVSSAAPQVEPAKGRKKPRQ